MPIWVMVAVLLGALVLAFLPRRQLNILYDQLVSVKAVRWFWPIAALALLVGFYVFREAYAFLGDGRLRGREAQMDVLWSTELIPGILANWVHDITTPGWSLDGWTSLAVVSIFAGVLFLGFLWLLGRAVWPDRESRTIGRLFIAGSGIVALFFGYIESYALPCALSVGFLLAAEAHRRGNLTFLPAPVLLLLSVAAHFSTIVLYPALVVLAWQSRGHRPLKIVTSFALGLVVALWGYWSFFLSSYAQSHPSETMLLSLFPKEPTNYGILSPAHWLDLANLVLLVVPGILIIVPLLLRTPGDKKRPGCSAFWLVAVLVPLAIPLLLDPKLGAARDWDLLSLGLVPVIVWSAVRLSDLPEKLPRGIVLLPIYVQLAATAMFVGINASAASGITRFETLLEIDKNRGGYGHEIAAEWYRLNKNPEREIYHWQQAAWLENNKRYWGGLAVACLRGRDLSFALRAAYRCRDLDSRWAEGAYYLASAYYELGNFDSANYYYDITLDLGPKHHAARHDRTMLLLNNDRPQEALYEIETALNLLPQEPVYHGLRGWALLELGRFEEAEVQLKKTLALNPDVMHAQVNLARLYAETGRYDEALQQTTRMLNHSALPAGLRPMLENLRQDILTTIAAQDTAG